MSTTAPAEYAIGAVVNVPFVDLCDDYGVGIVVAKTGDDKYTVKFAAGSSRRTFAASRLQPHVIDEDSRQERASRKRVSVSGNENESDVHSKDGDDSERHESGRGEKKGTKRLRLPSEASKPKKAKTSASNADAKRTAPVSSAKGPRKRRLSVAQQSKLDKQLENARLNQLRTCLDLKRQVEEKLSGAGCFHGYESSMEGGGAGVASSKIAFVEQDPSDYLLCFMAGACLTSLKWRKHSPHDYAPCSDYRLAHSNAGVSASDEKRVVKAFSAPIPSCSSNSSSSDSSSPRRSLSFIHGTLCTSILDVLVRLEDPPPAAKVASGLLTNTPADAGIGRGKASLFSTPDDASVSPQLVCSQKAAVQSLRFVLAESGSVSSKLVTFLLQTAACLEYEEFACCSSSSEAKAPGSTHKGDVGDDSDSDNEQEKSRRPSIARLSAVTNCLKHISSHLATTDLTLVQVLPAWRPSLVLAAGIMHSVLSAERRADARSAASSSEAASNDALELCILEARTAALGLLATALVREKETLIDSVLSRESLSRENLVECMLLYSSLLARRVVLLVREINSRESGTIACKKDCTTSSSSSSLRTRVGVSLAFATSQQLNAFLRQSMLLVDLLNTLPAGERESYHLSPTNLTRALQHGKLVPTAPLLAAVSEPGATQTALFEAANSKNATATAAAKAAPNSTRANMLSRVELSRKYCARTIGTAGAEVSPVSALMAFLAE